MRVFVYGALMRGAPGLEKGRAARVPGFAVRFVVRGLPIWEPSFAALVREEGGMAHGVVYEVSEADWAVILRREPGYEAVEVSAVVGEETMLAHALLIGDDDRLPSERNPSARYAGLLLEGAEKYSLPEEVKADYRSLVKEGSHATSRMMVFRPVVMWLTPRVGFTPAVAILLFVLLLPLFLLLAWLFSGL